MEYLLAQSNRGDQLSGDIGDIGDMPEVPSEEPEDDSGLDTTVCHAADLRAGDSDPPVAVTEAQVTSQVGDTGPRSPDAEVSEEEEDDTAIPSTSGQVMLLSSTIFYFKKNVSSEVQNTYCQPFVKLKYMHVQCKIFTTTLYIFIGLWLAFFHSVIIEVSWAGRQLMPWQPTWLA